MRHRLRMLWPAVSLVVLAVACGDTLGGGARAPFEGKRTPEKKQTGETLQDEELATTTQGAGADSGADGPPSGDGPLDPSPSPSAAPALGGTTTDGNPSAGASPTPPSQATAVSQASPTPSPSPAPVDSGERLFLAVGYGGVRSWSNDGKTWFAKDGDGAAGDNHFLFRDVIYANGRFCAVGGGTPVSGNPNMMRTATSTDGKSWDETADTGQWLGGVAWTGQYFVAVGGAGRALRSTDCRTWTQVRAANFGSGGPGHIRWVNYGNGVLTIGGDASTQSSTDQGTTWTSGLGNGPGERDRGVASAGGVQVETQWQSLKWTSGGQSGQVSFPKSPNAVTVRP